MDELMFEIDDEEMLEAEEWELSKDRTRAARRKATVRKQLSRKGKHSKMSFGHKHLAGKAEKSIPSFDTYEEWVDSLPIGFFDELHGSRPGFLDFCDTEKVRNKKRIQSADARARDYCTGADEEVA